MGPDAQSREPLREGLAGSVSEAGSCGRVDFGSGLRRGNADCGLSDRAGLPRHRRRFVRTAARSEPATLFGAGMDTGRRAEGRLRRSIRRRSCMGQLFHLSPEDQHPMFPVFAGHAWPEAPLMFTSGPQHGSVLGDFEGEPLYHGSLDPAEYRNLLDANGFAVVRHVVEDKTCGDHTIWLARARATAPTTTSQRASFGACPTNI